MISATRSRSPRRENRLVPRRRRRPRPPAAAVHHPGTFRASLDVLVPVGLPGTDGTGSAATAGLHRPGRRPGRRQCSPGEAVMTLLAPTLQTFFTDRLMRQLQRAEQEQAHEVGGVLVAFPYPVAQIAEEGAVVAGFLK